MKNLVLFTLIVTIFSGCQPKGKYISNEGLIYGTIYHITYENPSGENLKDEIEYEMNLLNRSLSTFDSTSVISKINNNQPVELDEYFLSVFTKATEVSKNSDGAFDMTVAPLVNAWGFGFKNKENITDELIDSLLMITGYEKIKLENGKIVKAHPSTMLDGSAIAKGFACDIVADYLRKKGCQNFMVEIGGEVVASGKNNKGRTWSIGISKPDDNEFLSNQNLKAIVQLPERALATSGNYRNYYIENGKKYAHTIDPKTGYPVEHSLLSTTVLADNCMTADAYATAFMVLGLEKSITLSKQVPEIEVYFIYADEDGSYQSYVSEGFKKLLKKEF